MRPYAKSYHQRGLGGYMYLPLDVCVPPREASVPPKEAYYVLRREECVTLGMAHVPSKMVLIIHFVVTKIMVT